MTTALVTGSGGLVGSAAVRHFIEIGYRVVGIDNDMRAYFFGEAASTRPVSDGLEKCYVDFDWYEADIRKPWVVDRIVADERPEVIIHAAAQPAHDWAAKEPQVDFAVNAVGTLNLLEATRKHCPEAVFVYCSTSKVYGDNPNRLPLVEFKNRLDLLSTDCYFEGIDTTMSIDQCTHSLFGASKASADLLVQEYGRYFGMQTVCFRPGCVSGGAHQGTQLHGFLSYMMRCAMLREPYTIIGYHGKQVRCNIHADDLVLAFAAFLEAPRCGAVYNIGGGRGAACSMWEALAQCERITGHKMQVQHNSNARIGDHRWWISDNREFETDYPEWNLNHNVASILEEIHESNRDRWRA